MTSVIITTYNRAGHLKYGLWSLLHQKVRPDEIVVVDDGSQDRTGGIVAGYQDDYPEANIRYIYNYNIGYTNCCLAKNIGLKEAKGDLLIFNEPEILHITEITQQHIETQRKSSRLFLSAGTVYFIFNNVVKRATYDELKNAKKLIASKSAARRVVEYNNNYFPKADDIAVSRGVSATYSASIRKEDLMAVGGWDERFFRYWGWDDIDLQSRLGLSGVETRPEPIMEVAHLDHGYANCFEVFEFNKKLHDDPNKPIVANQGKEWGIIRRKDEEVQT